MKICKKCKIEKSNSNFRKDKNGKDGLRNNCKDCENTNLLGKKTKREETNISKILECKICKKNKIESNFKNSRKKICKICAQNNEREIRRRNRLNKKTYIPLTRVKDSNFTLKQTAIQEYFKSYKYKGEINSFKDIELESKIKEFLLKVLTKISINVTLEVDVLLSNKNGNEFIVTRSTNRSSVSELTVEKVIKRLLKKLDDIVFDEDYKESGLTVLKIIELRVDYNPYVVSTGGSYIQLPQKIKDTYSCLNIKNEYDNKCFLWCLIAFFELKKEEQKKKNSDYTRVYLYNKEELIKNFNMTNVTYPVPLNQIEEIEKNNNLSINVYRLTESISKIENELKVTYPISLVYPENNIDDDKRKIIEDRHINLLLYKNHYVLIKSTRKLFSHCVSDKHSAFICEWCGVSLFTNNKALTNHELKCKFKYEHQKYLLPKYTQVEFKNYQKLIEVPFIIYSDFESYFEESTKENTDKTIFKKKHVPMGFGFKTVCRFDSNLNNEKIYIGKEADKEFVNQLSLEILRIGELFKIKNDIVMTNEDESNFNNSKICFICEQELREDKVRDHDHFTGKYRGAAHSQCNVLYTRKKYIVPVVFHNLEGYDMHLFVDALNQISKEFSIIPKSKEKYLALTIKLNDCRLKIRFLDSLHFFTGSLSENAKKITEFKFIPEEERELQKKQYFPYSYFTNLDKLKEECLPQNKDDWYNELTKESIKDDELKYANEVFYKFYCKNLEDYTKLYLKTDINLLAEVFEKFRDLSISTYGLDPAGYFTTPGFAWDAALKKTKIKLDLLNDREMIDFFIEKGVMRGGISTVCRKKYSKANNKHLNDYDKTKPSSYIVYFDVTNLYGYTMTGLLPVRDFKWLSNEEIDYYTNNLDELFKTINTETGIILEVNLIYPTSLKDEHIELPVAPEHMDGKLSPNLYSKYNYRLRVENLKFYLDKGLKLDKINKGIRFYQERWLKKYIDDNTELRKNSTDESAKNFYKLMNNAVYGKTMENVFSRKNFKLISNKNADKLTKLTRDPKFKKEYILTENLTVLEFDKEEIKFDKPIYVGFSILELSKLHMYNLHYNVIKEKFGNNATLMYMDTDSLVYEIFTEDIYEDLNTIPEYFDMSVYNKDKICFNPTNKGVLGTLKDEFPNNPIKEFVCLRSKCYSLKLNNENEVKKCKGIVKSELKRLDHETFIECNKNGGIIEVNQTTFKTINHDIYTIETKKDGLCRFDTKRIIDARLGDVFTYTIPIGYDKKNDLE